MRPAIKPKLLLGLALILSGGLFLTGCHGIGTQRFTAFTPAQTSQLETSSRIVLDVTCVAEMVQADYNLHENLSMLAPMPKHWKLDLTLKVDRVIKGEFNEKTIRLRWLRALTKEQFDLLGISPQPDGALTNKTLRIGFDAYSGEHLKNLRMIVRP